MLAVDGGHHNYHTAEQRYAPFAALLRQDGVEVVSLAAPSTPGIPTGIDVPVVANALNTRNEDRWRLPTLSALTSAEVRGIEHWVA